ncbi:MAG: septation protein IspZ [Gammaproteobacteria bacterium]|jgi:intracellular septation protein|nr:septation protein IspZ [Gammaproteobacteria bacterium]
MKQFLEFLPLVLFFGAYQMNGETISVGEWLYAFDGIYSATAVLMFSSVAVLFVAFVLERRLDKRLMWMTVAILVFGAATLIFRDQRFIQWKPTVFNWVLALVFLASQFVGDKNLLQRFLGQQLVLPRAVWGRLNLLYVAHFSVVGALNLFVAYRYEEAFWVSYKLYSSLGFTIALMALTVLLLFPHLKNQIPNGDTEDPMRGEL